MGYLWTEEEKEDGEEDGNATDADDGRQEYLRGGLGIALAKGLGDEDRAADAEEHGEEVEEDHEKHQKGYLPLDQ